jgi:phospholipid/cholesterol/gamma-HCH transport system substrate-binding protein
MLVGIIAISFLALRMGDIALFDNDNYVIQAKFTSASGLREGAFVEIAGVAVGKVKKIEFDPDSFLAVVDISLPKSIIVPDDSIASIRTAGIIGDKFMKISAGGSDTYVEAGMEIIETEPSINLEELISKYIFESGD